MKKNLKRVNPEIKVKEKEFHRKEIEPNIITHIYHQIIPIINQMCLSLNKEYREKMSIVINKMLIIKPIHIQYL